MTFNAAKPCDVLSAATIRKPSVRLHTDCPPLFPLFLIGPLLAGSEGGGEVGEKTWVHKDLYVGINHNPDGITHLSMWNAIPFFSHFNPSIKDIQLNPLTFPTSSLIILHCSTHSRTAYPNSAELQRRAEKEHARVYVWADVDVNMLVGTSNGSISR